MSTPADKINCATIPIPDTNSGAPERRIPAASLVVQSAKTQATREKGATALSAAVVAAKPQNLNKPEIQREATTALCEAEVARSLERTRTYAQR